MIINNLLKKIVNVKTENILILLYIPYMIINTSRANTDFILSAIVIHLLLLIGVYYSTYTTRQNLKEYIYKLKPIKIKLIDLQGIKKEIFTKAFNNIPTTAIIKNKTTF